MPRCVSTVRDRCLELERIIAARARSGSLGLDDALKLFDELLIHARPASVVAFNQILNAVSQSELVVSLFNRMVRECSIKVAPNTCTYSILIGCLCRMGRLKHSFATFGLILKTGWRVNDIVINQLLKGLCDGKRVGEAMDVLLQRMPELGCTPDTVSYSILLKGFCNENRAEEALELLRMMANDHGRSCPPNVVTYTTVIDGLCKAQLFDRAEGVFQQMIDNGVKPNNDTYNCLIHGYLSIGKWKEVVQMLEKMSARGLKPDCYTYGSLLNYLCKNGRCREARFFF
ncbi:hypothetical protein SORBI_3005G027680 [Sorghum bicolor]|uniref:Pentacotripeptide-repeat region of PRORP domain-containing protein n=1 Tax=Sorghum bicolor TaxID=4558 RepID=A0A1Z5RGE5_SORBI|nr:hypothetical protein SORBI_3005G027680 [Sorghum bicolor]